MPSHKMIAVIGLGQFGRGITDTLIHEGHDVLVIDKLEHNINDYRTFATHAVVADSTEESQIKSLGLSNFDYVIVAIGEDIQASILTTLILKDIGVKKVWVKSINRNHSKILDKIGADYIIRPEKEIAIKLVNQILHGHILDYVELSDEYSIVEIKSSKRLSGRTLDDLSLRNTYGISLLGIKEQGQIDINPSPDIVIDKKDILIIIGSNKEIDRFKKEAVYD